MFRGRSHPSMTLNAYMGRGQQRGQENRASAEALDALDASLDSGAKLATNWQPSPDKAKPQACDLGCLCARRDSNPKPSDP